MKGLIDTRAKQHKLLLAIRHADQLAIRRKKYHCSSLVINCLGINKSLALRRTRISHQKSNPAIIFFS